MKQLYSNNLTIGHGRGKQANVLFADMELVAGKGELVAVMGANGAGKSTLLTTLAGLHPPVSGKVWIKNGDTFNQLHELSRIRMARQMSFVASQHPQIDHLRVHDLVALGRYPYTNWMGYLSAKDHRRVQEVLQEVHVQHLAHRNITELSDGERQRVIIARSLAQDTPLILLDEPTAFLDTQNKFELTALLKKLAHEQGKCVIYSSHDLSLALQEADKIWLLTHQGFTEGAPEDLILAGQLDQLFPSPKVHFSIEKMGFAYHQQRQLQVNVHAEGDLRVLTLNALARNGFRHNATARWQLRVQAHPTPQWQVVGPAGTSSFSSIYDTMHYLTRQFPSKA